MNRSPLLPLLFAVLITPLAGHPLVLNAEPEKPAKPIPAPPLLIKSLAQARDLPEGTTQVKAAYTQWEKDLGGKPHQEWLKRQKKSAEQK